MLIIDLIKFAELIVYVNSLDRFCRGLIIDTKLGNILKTNRHNYVCVGYHGSNLLESDQRKAYAKQAVSFKEKHFVYVDTFFSLVSKYFQRTLVLSRFSS